jgi:UPF0042 nucleotide-binding protein
MTGKTKLNVRLISFGYKYGQPVDANVLFDVRFLPNPYWVEELRTQTGLDREVSDYVISSAEARNFLKLVKPLLLFLVQQYSAAAKKELVIAIGCTGGRHRSVAIVEVLMDLFRVMPVMLDCDHHDIANDS